MDSLIDQTILRVQDGRGKWSDASARHATHREFHDWATLWFHQRLGRYLDLGPLETTPEERESVLRLMVEQGFAPDDKEEGQGKVEVHQFQPRDQAEVVSGSLKGQQVLVVGASSSIEGFYDCVYHKDTGSGHRRQEVALSGGQLKLVKGASR